MLEQAQTVSTALLWLACLHRACALRPSGHRCPFSRVYGHAIVHAEPHDDDACFFLLLATSLEISANFLLQLSDFFEDGELIFTKDYQKHLQLL